MTLDGFIAGAGLTLAAFKEATIRESLVDKTFHLNREEIDWWGEVLAYVQYTELQEKYFQEDN